MQLVIVESPTKAKTIGQFLGNDFVIKSSYGHVRDLPKSELGIDIEHDFKPAYIIPTKAKKTVSALKKDAEKAKKIILATDEDREGEAIAWHLTQALGLTKSKGKDRRPKEIQRIAFHEITKSAIERALADPRDIDQNLVDAQQARRILDRLVGYKVSPVLWKRFYSGLSAGRVQSVAVRLIVEREREIERFVPDEYWTIKAFLTISYDSQAPNEIEALLVKIGDKELDKLEIKNQTEADKIMHDLEGAIYTVSNVERKETVRNPQAPFITSTLQQEASKRLHFSSKQTMMLAQQLYEAGYITYMRTDSVNLSNESLSKAEKFITDMFGKKYHALHKFKSKSKSAQEAHEAIRPTEPSYTPEQIIGSITPQQHKLYDLIWRRFLASQMTSAVFDTTAIDITALRDKERETSYMFRANGITLKFDGFLKIYPTKFEENTLPTVAAGQTLNLRELKPEQHFTKPPARYNEASLIKTLEKEGIGRPSTYATIISTILTRKYVEKDTSRAFHPTEIGILVNDFLVENFPKIINIKFTSHMEDELDDIATGKTKWVPVIREFYEPFSQELSSKIEEAKREKAADTEETDKTCEKCGSPMVIKRGRFGKFIACSNYPKCKNTKKISANTTESSG